jgi:hypothetical protein
VVFADTAAEYAGNTLWNLKEEAIDRNDWDTFHALQEADKELRERLKDEFPHLKYAHRQVCGKDVGARIFFYEAYHTLLVQEALWLEYGLRSFGIYDEIIVEKKGFPDTELTRIVEELLARTFPKVLEVFRSGELRHEHKPERQLSVGVERRVIDINLYMKRSMEC